MAVKEDVWELKPHTVGKHRILKSYLQAWLPILARSSPIQLMILDGFAGPGVYKNGELGSPIITLETVRSFKARFPNTHIKVVLIENKPARYAVLLNQIESRGFNKMKGVEIIPINDTFDGQLEQLFDDLSVPERYFTPCFAMIDPFGIKGVSLEHIRRILMHKKSEIYVP